MKKLFFLIMLFSCSNQVLAICFSGKGKGVIQYSNGKLAIAMDASSLTHPNPNDANWTCESNWIWLYEPSHSSDIALMLNEQSIANRMLSIATAAIKTNTSLRMCYTQDAANKCIATQVYDIGN